MAILKNTTISGTGNLSITTADTAQRPGLTTNIIEWTNTGSQAFRLIRGNLPTVTNNSWTAPAGVNEIEVLVVAGGGSGGNCEANGGTPGGGGGAGGLVYRSNFPVTPGTTYNVTVGAGGASQTSTNVVGNNGADSFFGSSANLVTNGTFTSNTAGWTVASGSEGTFTASGGRGILQQANSSDPPVNAYQAITCVVGRTYLVVGSKFSGDTAVVNITENFSTGGGSGGPGNVLYWSGPLDQGRKVNTFVATQTTMYVTLRINTNAFPAEAQFDDIGVYDYTTAINAIGGGGGGSDFTSGPFGSGDPARRTAFSGGSGGGGSNNYPLAATGPQISPVPSNGLAVQGTSGGSGILASGGGGAGTPGSPGNVVWGGGGAGLNFNISGTPTWYAGGGGAGAINGNNVPGAGGIGGGGQGAFYTGSAGAAATAGTPSTGGGGGGGAANGGNTSPSGAGGSGIVIIRYITSSNGIDARGTVRFNTDIQDVEVFDSYTTTWSAQDPTKNFARHNLFIASEAFDNAAWGKANINVTPNTIVSPIGTLTADVLTATSNDPYITQNISVIANRTYTASIWIKGTGSTIGKQGYWWAWFAGTATGTNTFAPAHTMTAEWQRISFSFTPTGSGTVVLRLDPADQGFTPAAATGDVYHVWGAQVEEATTAGTYIRTESAPSPTPFILAGYRVHSYTTVGTCSFIPEVSGDVEVLVVAGGGSGGAYGGNDGAGGGGAGGLIYQQAYTVTAGTDYTVTVGAGGVAPTAQGTRGNQGGISQFGPLIAIGGGGGGSEGGLRTGQSGGSGGGAGGYGAKLGGGCVIGQGNRGGDCTGPGDGGGGGAGGPGDDGTRGNGGMGLYFPQFGFAGYPAGWFAGGGGASGDKRNTFRTPNAAAGIGGFGGGGTGQAADSTTLPSIYNGVANTGGGGGAAAGVTTTGGPGTTFAGGTGGSGIVIVRYRFE